MTGNLYQRARNNLVAAVQLAPASRFHTGFAVNAVLGLLSWVIIAIATFPYGTAVFEISWFGVATWGGAGFVITLYILAIARLQDAEPARLTSMLIALLPWVLGSVFLVSWLLGLVRDQYDTVTAWYPLLALLGLVMVLALVISGLVRLYGGAAWRGALLTVGLGVALVVVDWQRMFVPSMFVYTPPATSVFIDPAARVDLEQVLFEQPQLLQQQLDRLAPQRPGVSDLYLLAVSSHEQAVFDRDVEYVTDLFERELGAAGRILVLDADTAALDDKPLPTRHNVRRALAYLGEMIDPNEDTVFVFLTSHGAASGGVEVRVGSLPLRSMTAAHLQDALDAAGIGWRMVVVSACYSGHFVAQMQDPRALLVSASAADRVSYGCGDDSPMTWFTEAFFQRGLAQGLGLTESYEQATRLTSERETAEALTPSQPQLFIGEAMEARLDEVELALKLVD